MAETVQTLTELVDEFAPAPASSKNRKTMEVREVYPLRDKQREAQAIKKMRAHLGIADIKLIPLEELHEQMKRNGICPEDNEFSRAIITEREK